MKNFAVKLLLGSIILATVLSCDTKNEIPVGESQIINYTSTSPITFSQTPQTAEGTISEEENGVLFQASNNFGISEDDIEECINLCTFFLGEYYGGFQKTSPIFNLCDYIEHDNFEHYINLKVELTDLMFRGIYSKYISLVVDDYDYEFGSENEYCFIDIKYEMSSQGRRVLFLVVNSDGILRIADMFELDKDSHDRVGRGNLFTLDDPEVWHNAQWAAEVENAITQRVESLNIPN